MCIRDRGKSATVRKVRVVSVPIVITPGSHIRQSRPAVTPGSHARKTSRQRSQHEIFGRKWKEEGREETTHAFTIRMLQKFPDWSDAEIAELVGVTTVFVEEVRLELSKKK